MSDKEALYATILGVQPPWKVTHVEVRAKQEEVTVTIAAPQGLRHACPSCGKQCAGYDTRRRSWRHLDTCQFKTILIADVPRVQCAEHGVLQIAVPWAEPNSGLTALMESLVIDWLLEANISAVARRMRLSWDEIDGVLQRAVRRGLERRRLEGVQRIGVDETSYQKRHEYVTTVCDLGRARVLYVADDRGVEALNGFYQALSAQQRAQIEVVAMDMWRPYIRATRESVPDAAHKIAFDRFHVARYFNDAVNDVRKHEHRQLRQAGDQALSGTKYLWLQNPQVMSASKREHFQELRRTSLKVARAWAIKETARGLWHYTTRGWAQRAWHRLLAWAQRSKLQPVQKAARTIREHLWGILNAVVLRATNATTESLNAKIQWIKKNACGFRNRARFKNAIYFHLGGLDLYPRPAVRTHTTS